MPANFRYFIHMAYNGAGFHGWQWQDNAPTVQQALNEALSNLLAAGINVTGCGRTDTGVHARNFYAHFDTGTALNAEKRKHLCFKLNSYLPEAIVILKILPVKAHAHARFDALCRTYQYFVNRRKDPFLNDFSYYLYGDIDIEIMNKAAEILKKHRDFTSFSKLHTQVKTNNCHISEACWQLDNHKLIFTISADRFLRNMVRAIVGTLLDVGRHKLSLQEFTDIIESKDRSRAGCSVPAKGLFLENITYPEDIFLPDKE